MKTKIKERLIFLINERHAGVKKGMADALGIQSASISDWTKDVPKCAPADEHINKICDYYHVSKSWLLGLSDEMHQENKQAKENIRFSKQEINDTEVAIHTTKIEQLLDRSQDFLDRYLTLVEQQQSIIENLSQTLNRITNSNTSTPYRDTPHEPQRDTLKKTESRANARKFRDRLKIPDDASH